jgi:hypothetical protein
MAYDMCPSYADRAFVYVVHLRFCSRLRDDDCPWQEYGEYLVKYNFILFIMNRSTIEPPDPAAWSSRPMHLLEPGGTRRRRRS